jgi:RND family efflux transporter MFP subunit
MTVITPIKNFRGNPFLTVWALLLPGMLLPESAQPQPQATPVGVDEVRSEPMSQTIPILGRFVAPQSGVIAARSPGPVARIRVSVGDHVKQGDILAELDQDRLRANLELEQARLQALDARRKAAEAKENYALQELRRLEKLRKTPAFSQYDYDSRAQELEIARSSREEAQAEISRGKVAKDLVEIELRDSQIRAPFPGVVTLRHTSEGAWLRVGDPVVTLVNDIELEIEADVPAGRLQGLQPGMRIEARLGSRDHARFEAEVRAVIPDEDPAARTRPVRLIPVLQGFAEQLAVNQAVMVYLPAGTAGEEIVSVAKDAVIRRGEQALVYLVKDGTAQPRPIQLGEAVGNRFQVLDGLNPGDVVVIRGNERLRPGQSVSYPGQPPQAAQTTEKPG